MKRASLHPDGRRPLRRVRLLAVATLLVIAVVASLTFIRRGGEPGQRVASQGNQHIAEIGEQHPGYSTNPPTSGWHVGNLAPWGAYDYVLPDELVLHNMEDGGVVLWYILGTPADNQTRIRQLEDIAEGYPKTVIAPRDDMPTPYAATAWQRIARYKDLDPAAMHEFLSAYHGIDHHAP